MKKVGIFAVFLFLITLTGCFEKVIIQKKLPKAKKIEAYIASNNNVTKQKVVRIPKANKSYNIKEIICLDEDEFLSKLPTNITIYYSEETLDMHTAAARYFAVIPGKRECITFQVTIKHCIDENCWLVRTVQDGIVHFSNLHNS